MICPAIGGTADSWQDVQCRVAEVTTVCVHDRNGLGRSDFKPKCPTAWGMAEELHALLQVAGIQPPYVLAGHSMGGLIVRVFTALYPGEVAGPALIDSSHPEQEERLPRVELTDYPGGIKVMVASWWARPLGCAASPATLASATPRPWTGRATGTRTRPNCSDSLRCAAKKHPGWEP